MPHFLHENSFQQYQTMYQNSKKPNIKLSKYRKY